MTSELHSTAASTYADVRLTDIILDDQADRAVAAIDQAEIKQLAATMRQQGLLQAIGVAKEQKGKYRLIFGRRRLMAARELGWKTIRASIIDAPTDTDVLIVREVENFQRAQLSLGEAALAVANLINLAECRITEADGRSLDDLDATTRGQVRLQAITNVATAIAKPAQWVRDHLFIAKLPKKARQLVMKDRLPLEHARWIAKLADPQLMDQIAEQAAINPDDYRGNNPMDIEDLRELVRDRMYSLTVVPWKLDRPFAKKPACDTCPANSANNPGLFDKGDTIECEGPDRKVLNFDASKNSICLRRSCFDAKTAEARKAIPVAARRAQKALSNPERKKSDDEHVRTNIAALTEYPWLREDRILERRETIAKSAPKPSTEAKAAAEKSNANKARKEKAEQDLRKALEKRTEFVSKHLNQLCAANPLLRAAVLLLHENEIYQRASRRPGNQKVKVSPGLTRVIDMLREPGLDSLGELAGGIKTLGIDLIETWDHWDTPIPDMVAAAIGLELKPAPTLEDFLPKPEKAAAPKAGKKTPTGKKAKASKSSKPLNTCTVCGEPVTLETSANDKGTLHSSCADQALDGGNE